MSEELLMIFDYVGDGEGKRESLRDCETVAALYQILFYILN